jgi:hypothetical protein
MCDFGEEELTLSAISIMYRLIQDCPCVNGCEASVAVSFALSVEGSQSIGPWNDAKEINEH